MSIKYADEIIQNMNEREPIVVPNNCVTGEAYEQWLYGDKTMNELSTTRQNHMIGVANKMKQMAIDDGTFNQTEIEDMWLLGYLHDIGYAYGEPKGHAARGGTLLQRNGYKHWLTVFNHGMGNSAIQYKELAMLNKADLTTDSNGCDITPKERLERIKTNYGEDSDNYKNIKILIETLFPDEL